ncbi:hypothetical protein HED60_23990 [Planctomycetales bacterium ZRK34]|nr:hypothetical protein HED60_23990 [Planctomycetales bacterium ZRK34]
MFRRLQFGLMMGLFAAAVMSGDRVAEAAGWQRGLTSDVYQTDRYTLKIDHEAFRISMRGANGEFGPSPDAGLWIRQGDQQRSPAKQAEPLGDGAWRVTFENGAVATVRVQTDASAVRLTVEPEANGPHEIRVKFAGGMNPAYGLGDHGGYNESFNIYPCRHDALFQHQDGQMLRFVSTFAVFAKHGLAMVVFDDGPKYVRLEDSGTVMGVNEAEKLDGFYLFAGSMPEIYAAYRQSRNEMGLPDARPDIDFFYPGFESYGALSWRTDQKTVTEMLSEYVKRGYPLRWAVVGSGFWINPKSQPRGPEGCTTSFALWGQRYPEPDALKAFLKQHDLKLIIGLRHGFPALREDGGQYDPAVHGPSTKVALERGYVLTDATGKPRTFNVHFPKSPVYLLGPDNPQAVNWFAEQAARWGADGYKEDFMFDAGKSHYIDDYKINPIDTALARDGAMVMVRCAAYSTPGSILRINDTDIRHSRADQDRIAINSLAYAASGQPNVYPDIVGGRPISGWNDAKRNYLTRMAVLSAVLPAMSFGNAPWSMQSEAHEQATLKAAKWHAAHVPYIFSAAMQSYETGYPYTITPLPIAYPDDKVTYDLTSRKSKQYQWLLGPSLLAAPLFGSDYDTVTSRDVYLPAGRWMDYETGQIFTGPTTLKDYPRALDAMPLFVGRTGVIVEHDESGKLWAEVYPQVADGTPYTFISHDGQRSTISIDGPLGSGAVRVHTTTRTPVKTQSVRDGRAIRFELKPGVDYRVSAGDGS